MRGMAESTKELIRFCKELLSELNPMTLRQLHYAIFSRDEIDYTNTKKDYRRLSRVTTDARRAYRAWELEDDEGDPPELSFPGSWIVDETREAERVNVWENAAGYIDTVKRCYRRDNWQDQENYCEIWSEKATVLSSIRPIANKWGITLRVCHGFGSTGMESDTGLLFERVGEDKEITVFYLGDHDPSGHCIEEDIHRRVEASSGRHFDMVRLAIHPEDISLFNLPPQMIKDTDTRARSFREKYGDSAATIELDALPVDELRNRIEDAVQELLDMDLWNHQLRIQQVEFESIARIADTIKNLPQMKAGA
jgi:hypothetical protein